jgi:hypothetical protein
VGVLCVCHVVFVFVFVCVRKYELVWMGVYMFV